MPVIQGTTTGSIAGMPYNIPSTITSFSLSNTAGTDITATLYIVSNETGDKVAIMGDGKTILANDAYISNVPIKMLAGYTIYLLVSGSCDYYFSIS